MAVMEGYSLHECAVQAEASLEKLATELASAGADRSMIDSVESMAKATRGIVSALGQGQGGAAPQPSSPSQRPSLDSATAALHQDVLAGAQGGAY